MAAPLLPSLFFGKKPAGSSVNLTPEAIHASRAIITASERNRVTLLLSKKL
jgi:hypothetical protein